MRLVVDTNVLVSGLLKPGSVPDRALAAIWETGATVLYDARIEDEYRAVLARPKFRAIERHRIDALLDTLFTRGERVGAVAEWTGDAPDPDDRIFVEVALTGRAHALITGNLRHFPTTLGFDVLPPATLLARLGR